MKNKLFLCALAGLLLTSCATGKLPSTSETNSTNNEALEAWLKTEDAKDYNQDGLINDKDYSIYLSYKEWKKDTEHAKDYNGDRRITIEDYLYSLQFDEWIAGEESFDYNEDGSINIDDFQIHINYMDWLDSDSAMDLNEDRLINYDDYQIYLDPSSSEYLSWLRSPEAKDYNKDGNLNKKDYIYFNYFGTYEIVNFVHTGNLKIGFNDVNEFFIPIKAIAEHTSFTFNESGINASINPSLLNRLKEKDKASFIETLKNIEIEVPNEMAFNLGFEVNYENVPVVVKLYFTKDKETSLFTTTYTTKINDLVADISFDLFKNA